MGSLKYNIAGVAQLVEHNLAKVRVAGSSPVSRSNSQFGDFAFLFFLLIHLHNLQKDCVPIRQIVVKLPQLPLLTGFTIQQKDLLIHILSCEYLICLA